MSYNVQAKGKCGITATVIQDSIANGIRLTTFELDYPRFVHAELMTHRMFSRNAASSRAIPIAKMHEHIKTNMAMPVHWGKNQSGMQAKTELNGIRLSLAKVAWKTTAHVSILMSKLMDKIGLHKQIANRVTESAQMMKVIVTATEWDNWYYLRDHSDAQPEIHELASTMRCAHNASFPVYVPEDGWHVPYVERELDSLGHMYYLVNGKYVTLEEAKMISASCCAQVSYRKSDESLIKAKVIFDKLINSKPAHASPVEHQATPAAVGSDLYTESVWQPGVTHVDRKGVLWSGNFREWIQHRQLLEV